MSTTYNVNITVAGKDNASAALGNVNTALSTLAGVTGGMFLTQALSTVASGLGSVAGAAITAAADMQRFTISLETLAAREAVQAGQFENIGQAINGVGEITDGLMEKLKELSLISPFTFDTVYNTFRTQMAFGQTAEMSIKLTGAILDTASALGLTSEATDRMAYNFAQINSIGKIMAMDMRQLRMVGLDLAGVLKDELGMSVEEVNAALEEGSITMKDVSEAFVRYAGTNFAGAAERMSLTFQGLQSSFHDLFFFMSTDMLGGSLESVTGYLTEMFQTARDLQTSGYFEKIGTEITGNVDRIMVVFQDMLGADGPESVIKKLAEGMVKLSDSIADVLEWYNSLSADQKDLIGDVVKLALVIPPLVLAFKAISTTVVAAQGIMQAFSLSLSGTAAILGPLALAIGAAALAWGAYNKVQKIAADGQEKAAGAWQKFFDTQIEKGATAAEILDAYREKQAGVNKILEEANPIVAAIVKSKMDDINTTEMLIPALMKASTSYGDFVDVMFDAGLGMIYVSEEQYNLANGIETVGVTATTTNPLILDYGAGLGNLQTVTISAADAQAQLDNAMTILKMNIAGALGNELLKYGDTMVDMTAKQDDLNAKVAELEAKSYLTPAQVEELGKLKGEQDEIKQKFIDVAAEHTKQTNTILYNMAQQQLAMSSLDPTTQLAVLQSLADKLGIVDTATSSANTAFQGLVAQTNTTNAHNLAAAMASIASAALDGKVTAEEFKTALDVLNGTVVTATVNTNYDNYYKNYYEDYYEHEALGGDFLVTRPTVFLAGENGDEHVSFSPQNGLTDYDGDKGGSTTITFINRDRASAALALAYVDRIRSRRLSTELGRT